jgi:hypothetical protein
MIPEIVGFLGQTSSPYDNTPVFHPDNLLGNEYATALPLVYFLNLIFSKALLIDMAGRSFKAARTKNKQHQESLKLWGINVPHCEDRQHTYQFWVIHLKGQNGLSFITKSLVNDKSKFTKFESSLVNFFNLQFDNMREDERQNIQDGLVKDCETIYVAAFNLIHQNTIKIVAALQFCTSPEGT